MQDDDDEDDDDDDEEEDDDDGAEGAFGGCVNLLISLIPRDNAQMMVLVMARESRAAARRRVARPCRSSG